MKKKRSKKDPKLFEEDIPTKYIPCPKPNETPIKKGGTNILIKLKEFYLYDTFPHLSPSYFSKAPNEIEE